MTSKAKIFIIAPKELYFDVNNKLNKIIDINRVNLLLPYDFQHLNYIDSIIFNLAQKHLVKSYDYITSLPGAEKFNHDEIEYFRNIEAYDRGYQEWLESKFKYSKKQIEECNLCLVFDSEDIDIDEIAKKEMKNEIRFATNKNKFIKTIYIKKKMKNEVRFTTNKNEFVKPINTNKKTKNKVKFVIIKNTPSKPIKIKVDNKNKTLLYDDKKAA